jgi:hypothetical protein
VQVCVHVDKGFFELNPDLFLCLSLKLWRLPSSIFTCRSFSSSSFILASCSKFFRHRFQTLSSMAFQKVDPAEAMATGSLLTCSIMGICVMTDIGFPPITRTFFSCSCTIIPDALSYTNFLRLGTSFGLNGVPSPKLSPLAPTVDISGISVSIGTVSLFLASSSFFLFSSFVTLSATSLASFSIASFVVVAVATPFLLFTFCSTSFWATAFAVASSLALALASSTIFLFFSVASFFFL